MNRFNYPPTYTSPYGGYPQNNDRFHPPPQMRPYPQESFPYGRTNAPYDPRVNSQTGTFPYSGQTLPRRVTPPVKKEEEESISVSESDDDDDDKKAEVSDNEDVSASDNSEEEASDNDKAKSDSEEEEDEEEVSETKKKVESESEEEEEDEKESEENDDEDNEEEEDEEVETKPAPKKVESREDNEKALQEQNLKKRVKELNHIKFEMEDLESSLKKAFKFFDTNEPTLYDSYVSSTSNSSRKIPSEPLKTKETNEVVTEIPKENIMAKSNTSFSKLPDRQELIYSRYSNSKPSTANLNEDSISARFLRQ